MAAHRFMVRVVSLLCIISLSYPLITSVAQADDLDAQRRAAEAAAAQAQANVNNSVAARNAAAARVQAALSQVAAAQTALAAAEKAWQEATAAEAQAAIELYKANQALQAAQAEVAAGRERIARQQGAINAYARSVVQDSMPLVSIAVLINLDSTASLANRLQWNDTVLATSQIDLNALRQLQAALYLAESRCEAAQAVADRAKQQAEARLKAAETVRETAQQAQAALLAALQEQQAALADASWLLSNDQSKLAQAQSEVDRINSQIQGGGGGNTGGGNTGGNSGGGNSGGSTPPPSQPPTTPPAADLSPAEAKAAAYGMVQAYGWNDTQYQCLVNLWERESNWRWWAENPYSGAYGIPQSLPANKMASAGADWKTNARTQIAWGLNYIDWRYDTPCGAWSFWQTNYWY